VITELSFFVIPFIISVIAVLFVAKQNKKMKITGKDINKINKRELPEGVGLALLAPLWTGIIMFNLLIAENTGFIAFGLTITVLCIVGFLDDRKQKFKVRTVSWTSRAAIVSLVCMMFAMFYAPNIFWILPFAIFVAGLASFENTFAGLNGWEVGSGFIIACFVALLLVSSGPLPIAIALVGTIAGLLIFNVYPAKVFPGDSGTLLIGGSIACIIILTQRIELIFLTVLFFLPHITDFLLKFLTNKDDMSQSKNMPYAIGKVNKLRIPQGKPRYDFAKMLLKIFGPMHEWLVVAVIWTIVAANCLFWILVFSGIGLL